ncbi:MAG: hypothetical protein KIT13_08880 [Burkholderiales bacterium]|nr:hypothetical protein [Burkholderiales bacterium]
MEVILGNVMRGIGFLYWVLAIGGIVLAIRMGKSVRSKAIGAVIVVAVFGFLPGKMMVEQRQRDTYAKEAWAYFRKLCDEKSGEKIYKTFTDVKSVLVVRSLPPATEKDLYDQFWYGDPYSNTTPWNKRGESAALMLASRTAPVAYETRGRGYDYVEMRADSSDVIVRYSYPVGSDRHGTSISDKSESRFGISWEDISKPEDRRYWVAGSRLSVIDLTDNSIVAERIGYLIEAGFGATDGQRRPWLSSRGIGSNGRSCPDTHDYSDRWFLLKVLKPTEEVDHGK